MYNVCSHMKRPLLLISSFCSCIRCEAECAAVPSSRTLCLPPSHQQTLFVTRAADFLKTRGNITLTLPEGEWIRHLSVSQTSKQCRQWNLTRDWRDTPSHSDNHTNTHLWTTAESCTLTECTLYELNMETKCLSQGKSAETRQQTLRFPCSLSQ